MRAALKSKAEDPGPPSPKQTPAVQPAASWSYSSGLNATASGQQAFAEQPQRAARQPLPDRFHDQPTPQGKDVVDRGLLSMATARQLFETYRNDLFPHYPTVAIPQSVTADEWRRGRPTLFLAIIAAAAGKSYSDLAATLDKEVLQAYVTRILIQSEKSLELVEALLISAVWYHPPSNFRGLKYYEYIHMAATMAMDIGIGSRPLQHRSRFGNASRGREPAKQAMLHPAEDPSNPDLSMTPRSPDSSTDTGNLESRRTFLACYMICAGVSLSLRRPNMLKINSYVRECLEYIKRSPDAIPTDRILTSWAELVIIGEDICTSLAFDDPGGIASITEFRTQLMLKDFEKRLAAWYASQPASDLGNNGSMTIMYWTVRLYLYEIALHVDHSPEDFKAPYQMGAVHPSEGIEVPTQALAEAVAESITCSHALLNVFLAMPVDSLRTLPVFSYVRVSFAAFVLAKLCLSAVHAGSRIGKVLDRSSLRVEGIMDKTILHVREVVGSHRCRVPAIFLALLFKLRQWCLNPGMIGHAETGGVPSMIAAAIREPQASQPTTTVSSHFDASVEGPRIVEQSSSSSENTPKSPAGGQQVAFESVKDSTAENSTYQATYGVTNGVSEVGYSVPFSAGNTASDDSLPVGSDQMQFDEDFMQYFNDLAGLSDGGLTGFDELMPTDMTGFGDMHDMSSWQATPDTGGTAGF